MTSEITYSKAERIILWTIAIVGVTVINGAFFYGVLVRPGALRAALTNPIAVAFMVEATLLLVLLAYLLRKWGVSRFGPFAFVLLSLLGTMAFAVPLAVLSKKSPVPEGS
jgi:hypothetical protein